MELWGIQRHKQYLHNLESPFLKVSDRVWEFNLPYFDETVGQWCQNYVKSVSKSESMVSQSELSPSAASRPGIWKGTVYVLLRDPFWSLHGTFRSQHSLNFLRCREISILNKTCTGIFWARYWCHKMVFFSLKELFNVSETCINGKNAFFYIDIGQQILFQRSLETYILNGKLNYRGWRKRLTLKK